MNSANFLKLINLGAAKIYIHGKRLVDSIYNVCAFSTFWTEISDSAIDQYIVPYWRTEQNKIKKKSLAYGVVLNVINLKLYYHAIPV